LPQNNYDTNGSVTNLKYVYDSMLPKCLKQKCKISKLISLFFSEKWKQTEKMKRTTPQQFKVRAVCFVFKSKVFCF